MPERELAELVTVLRATPAWHRKHELDVLTDDLVTHAPLVDGRPVRLGDDAAAIETDDGYLLLAAEVIYPPLVRADPYLAGRSAVLANVNDIYAMGGYPLAVVDTILARDVDGAAEIARGLKDGCARYDVPLVGGHLTATGDVDSVAACILGRASALLSGFEARPGDVLLYATKLEGTFHPRFTFWDCSSQLADEHLRRDLAVLPAIAEAGWCGAARDVSMTGLLGSTLMLLELSGVGGALDLDAVPCPPNTEGRFLDWLLAFPSYGFVLAVPPEHVADVQAAFTARKLTCDAIGEATTDRRVTLCDGRDDAELWNFEDEPFTGFSSR